MDSKLTLKLDKEVIEKAKIYAVSHKRSLSRIIESYLQSITISDNEIEVPEIEISPFVKEMASGVNLKSDIDYKKEYSAYLSEKYK